MGLTPGAIDLRVEALVLEGVDPGSRHAVGEALQTELVRLLTEQPPTFEGDATLGQLHANAPNLSVQAPPQGLGGVIAGVVHGGLTR